MTKAKQEVISVVGVEMLERTLKHLGVRAAASKKKVVMRAAEIVREAAADNAPKLSGNLAENIVIEVLDETENDIAVGVGPAKKGHAYYGLILEFGADRHIVRKKKRKVLGGYDEFFGSAVEHPGLPARPWLRPAFDENVYQALSQAAAEVKRSLGI